MLQLEYTLMRIKTQSSLILRANIDNTSKFISYENININTSYISTSKHFNFMSSLVAILDFKVNIFQFDIKNINTKLSSRMFFTNDILNRFVPNTIWI